jgi:hypothetical protein
VPFQHSFKRLMKLHYILLYFTVYVFPVCGLAQTDPSPTAASATTGATSNSNPAVQSWPAANPEQRGQNPSSTELNPIVVIGQLNEARDQIVPYLGATRYSIGQEQIQTQSQGSNAPFNQVILRMPGVAQDSYGQLHVRDEHANLQFRIDDVLIPEGSLGSARRLIPIG